MIYLILILALIFTVSTLDLVVDTQTTIGTAKGLWCMFVRAMFLGLWTYFYYLTRHA